MKKIVIGAVLSAVVGYMIFGFNTFSYVKTATSLTKNAVQDAIPIEFELARAKTMIKGIVPEIAANLRLIAKEQIEVDNLEKQIARMTTNLTNTKEQLVSDPGNANRTKFDQYKSNEKVLKSMKTMFTNRSQKLVNLKDRVQNMMGNRTLLALQVTDLQNRLDNAKTLQEHNVVALDTSNFNRLQELMTNLEQRVKVEENIATMTCEPTSTESNVDIKDEVTEYFGLNIRDKVVENK